MPFTSWASHPKTARGAQGVAQALRRREPPPRFCQQQFERPSLGRCPAWRSARRTPRRRHREAEVSAEAPPRGELRGLRERIDDGASGRNAAARVAEAPEPRQGRRLGLRGAVACPQAHRRASTRGNGPRAETKAGDRERGACHPPTSGTRGCSHLSRCSDRTYEQHQTNEEATTHHAKLLGAAARVPIGNTMPLLLYIAIIVLAGWRRVCPSCRASRQLRSPLALRTDLPSPSPRMILGR